MLTTLPGTMVICLSLQFEAFQPFFSPGFLFSHLEAIVTGVEVEKPSLTLVTWGKIFVGISFIQLFLVIQARG